MGPAQLDSITRGQPAVRECTCALVDRIGYLPPMPCVFPDDLSPLIGNELEGQVLVMARWSTP